MSMAEWRSLSTIRIRAAAVMCAPRRRRGCEVLTHAPAWRKGHCRTGFAQVFAKFLRRNPKGENSATAAVENPASAGKFCLQSYLRRREVSTGRVNCPCARGGEVTVARAKHDLLRRSTDAANSGRGEA